MSSNTTTTTDLLSKVHQYVADVSFFSFLMLNITWVIVNQWNTAIYLSIYNGAKLGDATVARAPPLLCHPRNL